VHSRGSADASLVGDAKTSWDFRSPEAASQDADDDCALANAWYAHRLHSIGQGPAAWIVCMPNQDNSHGQRFVTTMLIAFPMGVMLCSLDSNAACSGLSSLDIAVSAAGRDRLLSTQTRTRDDAARRGLFRAGIRVGTMPECASRCLRIPSREASWLCSRNAMRAYRCTWSITFVELSEQRHCILLQRPSVALRAS
jgi:hypothetical protein